MIKSLVDTCMHGVWAYLVTENPVAQREVSGPYPKNSMNNMSDQAVAPNLQPGMTHP